MRCTDIQEWLWEYWDMPETDIRRLQINQHIKTCRACAEEFRKWQQNEEWIRSSAAGGAPAPASRISESVMSRIYRQESWRAPVVMRTVGISERSRKWSAAMLSFFLALFAFSLIQSVSAGPPDETGSLITELPAARAGDVQHASLEPERESVLEGIPVASISDPLLLRVDIVRRDPNYWLVFSLFGIVSVLMIMNWLSRVRS